MQCAYHVDAPEAYVSKPESDVVASRPSATWKTVENQPFTLPQKNVNDPRVHIHLTTGSYSFSASQITDLSDEKKPVQTQPNLDVAAARHVVIHPQ